MPSLISAWVFSCKFAAYFQNTFLQEHLWRAASNWRSPVKKGFQKISQNSLETPVSELRLATLFKKKTLAQVFFCEFFEIFKNNLFTEHH